MSNPPVSGLTAALKNKNSTPIPSHDSSVTPPPAPVLVPAVFPGQRPLQLSSSILQNVNSNASSPRILPRSFTTTVCDELMNREMLKHPTPPESPNDGPNHTISPHSRNGPSPKAFTFSFGATKVKEQRMLREMTLKQQRLEECMKLANRIKSTLQCPSATTSANDENTPSPVPGMFDLGEDTREALLRDANTLHALLGSINLFNYNTRKNSGPREDGKQGAAMTAPPRPTASASSSARERFDWQTPTKRRSTTYGANMKGFHRKKRSMEVLNLPPKASRFVLSNSYSEGSSGLHDSPSSSGKAPQHRHSLAVTPGRASRSPVISARSPSLSGFTDSKKKPSDKEMAALALTLDNVGYSRAAMNVLHLEQIHKALNNAKPQAPVSDHTMTALDALLTPGQFNSVSGQWEDAPFSIFEFRQHAQGKPLSLLVYCLFERSGLLYDFEIDLTKFKTFCVRLEDGYFPVPYHNKLHAADVCYTLHQFITENKEIHDMLSPVDLFAGTLAAAMHDYAHPGTNNVYHTKSESALAVLYNDHSVLEQYHCAQAWALLKSEDCYFYKDCQAEMKKEVRETVCSMILATDMKRHFKLLANLKDVVAVGKKPLFEKQQDRLLLLNALIHAADIGNPCKPVPEFKRWTEMLFKEFFSQGDREKKAQLPISFLCDRADTNIAEAQVGFCKFIVLPMYNGLLPINPAMSWRIENIQENVNYWTNVDKAATAAEDAGTNPVSKT